MAQNPDQRAAASDAPQAPAPADTGVAPPSLLARAINHPRMPYFFLGSVLLAALVYAFSAHLPSLSRFGIGTPSIVLFDPVKFANAQRAAISLLQANKSADLALTMTQVARHAEAVIREEARGAIVLVRQTVVAPGDMPDITDAVLTRFGLTTNVPTISTDPGETTSLEQLAPTDSAFSPGKLREDYLLQLGERNARAAAQQQTHDSQANILP